MSEQLIAALADTMTPRTAVAYAIRALTQDDMPALAHWLGRAQSLLNSEDDPTVDHIPVTEDQ